jgi:hypothetical protein
MTELDFVINFNHNNHTVLLLAITEADGVQLFEPKTTSAPGNAESADTYDCANGEVKMQRRSSDKKKPLMCSSSRALR